MEEKKITNGPITVDLEEEKNMPGVHVAKLPKNRKSSIL